jgi:hypothetical protein
VTEMPDRASMAATESDAPVARRSTERCGRTAGSTAR